MRAMILAFLACVFANCISAAQAAPSTKAQPPASVCGHWVVTKIIPTSGISTTPRKEFLGVEVKYLPSEMQFGNEVTVHHPQYAVEHQSASEFFKESYIRPSELGIKGHSILIINVEDGDGKDVIRPGASIFVRNSRELITLWDGVYYLLKKKSASCGEASPKSR